MGLFYSGPLSVTIQRRCSLARPNAVRGQPWSAEIYLRFQISRDHVLTHKFRLPFRIVTGHKLGAGHLRMAPEGQSPSGPPRSPRNSR